jgi:superfamily II DNA/RNA helicase
MSNSFRDFDIQPEVLSALDEAGFDTPMPIQQQAIPILIKGRDLIGVAETGTGKTLAFVLPMFRSMPSGERDPRGLVVCPTRELAMQVAGEAERFGRALGVRIVLAYGGTSSGDQKRALNEGCDLVVGTPGRLLDFIQSAWMSTRNLRHVVLDEADRMLDMGFINDVDAILRKTPASRQTMLFSATISPEVRRLSERYMYDPALVRMHRGTRVKSTVDHALYPVHPSQKAALLVEILHRENPTKFLVFTATREGTSELALQLRRHRFEVISLSSLLSQANRERALDVFRKGECQALVATDVAARGLDITDIDLVINYDVPMQAEDYVHRIGRTGRAERTGKAVTLVTDRDDRRIAEIERLLGEKVPRTKLEGFAYRTGGGGGRGGDRGGSSRKRAGGGRREGSDRRSSRGRRRSRGGRSKPRKDGSKGTTRTGS